MLGGAAARVWGRGFLRMRRCALKLLTTSRAACRVRTSPPRAPHQPRTHAIVSGREERAFCDMAWANWS
eukprot:1763960-Pleurochrysis_carterae.AAC.1